MPAAATEVVNMTLMLYQGLNQQHTVIVAIRSSR